MAAEGSVEDRAEKERVCETILKSRTFSRSEQLQAFLRFICEMELAGRGHEITEYSIATSALHRRADYSPNEDSSVRSRAHALRRKLQEFYENEAAADSGLRIELPKGTYRPRFVAVDPTSPEIHPTPVAMPPAPAAQRALRPVYIGAGIATALITSGLLLFWGLGGLRGPALDAVVREAWGPILAPSSDVLIVIGCPPLARVLPSAPGILPRGNVMLPAPDAIREWYAGYNLEKRGGPEYMFPTRNYTLFADTLATAHLGTVMNSAGVSFQAVPEVGFRPTTANGNGLVLIGSPAYTAFIARVQKVTPLAIRFNPALNDEEIGDGPPGSARTAFRVRRDAATQRFATVYGLITVLPSQPGRDRPQRTIVFSGIMGSPGAQAGIQFFTSPVAMRDLKERFRREGYDKFPPAYQVVVRSGVDNDAAINAVYEAHRVMSTTPVIE